MVSSYNALRFMRDRVAEPEEFESTQSAFDACRERDRPLTVSVPEWDGKRKVLTVFPSGFSKPGR